MPPQRNDWKPLPPEVKQRLFAALVHMAGEVATDLRNAPSLSSAGEHRDGLLFAAGLHLAMQMNEIEPEFMAWIFSTSGYLDDPVFEKIARNCLAHLHEIVNHR